MTKRWLKADSTPTTSTVQGPKNVSVTSGLPSWAKAEAGLRRADHDHRAVGPGPPAHRELGDHLDAVVPGLVDRDRQLAGQLQPRRRRHGRVGRGDPYVHGRPGRVVA